MSANYFVLQMQKDGSVLNLGLSPEQTKMGLLPERVIIICYFDMQKIYIWIGQNAEPGVDALAMDYAIKIKDNSLQQAKLVLDIIKINGGLEPQDFRQIFNMPQPPVEIKEAKSDTGEAIMDDSLKAIAAFDEMMDDMDVPASLSEKEREGSLRKRAEQPSASFAGAPAPQPSLVEEPQSVKAPQPPMAAPQATGGFQTGKSGSPAPGGAPPAMAPQAPRLPPSGPPGGGGPPMAPPKSAPMAPPSTPMPPSDPPRRPLPPAPAQPMHVISTTPMEVTSDGKSRDDKPMLDQIAGKKEKSKDKKKKKKQKPSKAPKQGRTKGKKMAMKRDMPMDMEKRELKDNIEGLDFSMDEDEEDITPMAPDVDEGPKDYHKNLAVEYFDKMNPEKYYPLIVDIADIEQAYVAPVQNVLTGEQKIQKKETMDLRLISPIVTIRPIFPGCAVTPTQLVTDFRLKEDKLTFYVTPIVKDNVEGRIDFLDIKGNIVHTAKTPAKVDDPRYAKTIASYGALASILPRGLLFFDIDVGNSTEMSSVSNMLPNILGTMSIASFIGIFGAIIAFIVGLFVYKSKKPNSVKTSFKISDFRIKGNIFMK
jgi:hypothetical protein